MLFATTKNSIAGTPLGQPRALQHRGFTLVEMVVVIVVVGAIFALGSIMLGRAFESYKLTRDTTDVDWQGRVALERMVRELRDIRSRTAADLPAWGANDIDFYDTAGNRARFYLSGSTLTRSEGVTTNPQPLADNATALNFYYFKTDGTTAGVGEEDQIYYITVRLTVATGDISETYRVTVRPRRFK